jgi:hypothetical protein
MTRDESIVSLVIAAEVLNDTDPLVARQLLRIAERLRGESTPLGVGALTEVPAARSEYDLGYRDGRRDRRKGVKPAGATVLREARYCQAYIDGYGSGYADTAEVTA